MKKNQLLSLVVAAVLYLAPDSIDVVSWSDPHNWSGDVVPRSGSDVTIGTLSGHPTIQLTSTVGTTQISGPNSSKPDERLDIPTSSRYSQIITLADRPMSVQDAPRNEQTAADCWPPAARQCGPHLGSVPAFAKPCPSFLRGKSFRSLHTSIQYRP